ncbi:MAG TPA: hypothetical protein VFK92_13400 [Burkholderiales bacterium]|nr:hypothetical protein [Burkholderiales bacterium]
MTRQFAIARLCGAALLAAAAGGAFAHGFAGKRFFPATLATDDPFVADELSLPTVARRKTGANGNEPAALETDASVDFTKRITPDFGIGLGATYVSRKPDDGAAQRGFDNFAANMKYQFYKSDAHETILSAGVDWDIGNTGAKRIGAEPFSTLTPAIFAGKGFGDLPDSLPYLKPFAVTGSVGVAMPAKSSTTAVADDGTETTTKNPNALNVGFAFQYSLLYLQSFVKDVGLSEPFNRLIPLVEVSLQKPLDRGGGPTTGTINPGVLWAGRYMQFGLEAIIPMNRATGGKTGVLFQIHFFMDDLFPKTIGKPVFGD